MWCTLKGITRLMKGAESQLRKAAWVLMLSLACALAVSACAVACTSFIAGKNATTDGSVISAHNEDLSADTCERVEVFPGKTFKEGEIEYLGSGEALPWVAAKYKVIQFNSGYDVNDYNGDNPNFVNQFGVSSWDNAMTPRKELLEIESRAKNLVDSKELKRIPLERAKSAREAVQILGFLVDTFGFIRNGMCYGIADPKEGWIVEVTQGKHWVAQRVPDDMVVMRSNCYRIGDVDLSDTQNFLASKNLIDYAIERGWYDPAIGAKFNFAETYGSPDSLKSPGNTQREWGGLTFLKPSLALDPNGPTPYVAERGIVNGVVPDDKITVENAMEFLRIHYEGTSLDGSAGYAKGSPHWTTNRVICVNTTNCSSVVQHRSWLPTEIGSVIWRADNTPCCSVFVPWYLGITTTPVEFRTGTSTPTDDSAWWLYTRIANTVDAHYAKFIGNVRPVFKQIEADLLTVQPFVENAAYGIYMISPQKCAAFLTNYSGGTALNALGVARKVLNDLVRESARGSWRNP